MKQRFGCECVCVFERDREKEREKEKREMTLFDPGNGFEQQ